MTKKKEKPQVYDAVISLRTLQNCDDDEPDVLDFLTDGEYSFGDDIGRLDYEETEVTGMTGTRTSLTITPDRVIVDRRGNVNSRMEFAEGERNSFLYSTPFGQATMSLNTRSIRRSFNENGGRAEIEYVIDVDHALFTKNRFIINVTRTEGNGNA